MKINKIVKLGLLRFVTLVLMLAQNFVIVRYLTLEEIGQYYLIATIAYLGNAVVYVGADLHLQRQLADLSVESIISPSGLLQYIVVTASYGAGVVLLFSSIYFSQRQSDNWILPALICCALAVATYLSSLSRNLLQLAAHPTYSSLGPLTEGIFRTGMITALAFYGKANAHSVASISAMGALFAATLMLTLLGKACRHVKHNYLTNQRHLLMSILPIGGSGLLNWAQLQGYRPLVSSSAAGTQIVGTVSFMSTLGSTAANAAFTILGQFQVPHQYQSKGSTTPRYLMLLSLLTVALALASIPAGVAFLWLTEKMQLLSLVYLVALGVILEAGNAAIGVCTNHLNVRGEPLWQLPLAGLIGCLATFSMLLSPQFSGDKILLIAFSLITGQLITIVVIISPIYMKRLL